ncbi:butyrate kinase [Thermoanaerobacter ethanolicus JW 200]|uniref:butyrate kinase n=1 Tax=Thermoanaerobacter ethanolicus TaxID=1757 RepID=UPI000202C796|nr:butyrate kinase [Thermoanaerobacter ethanolicus JW 200]
MYKILVINPGSTSTKLAVYEGENEVFNDTIRHSSKELSKYNNIIEQLDFRVDCILNTLLVNNFLLSEFDAVVGRGGLIKPVESGTYIVNDIMINDLKNGIQGEHASNLGGIIARLIADKYGILAFIVDPVVVDELEDVARITGIPEIKRKSRFHALNQKAVARRLSKDISKEYEKANLIIAHLGGGISVGAHKKGRIVDVNDAINGDGPFSPERAGGLPALDVANLCFSGKYGYEEIKKMINGKGGMTALLGTNDVREVLKRINNGNKYAKLVFEAMAYRVAKEIGSMAAVLKGHVDAIGITGGIAYSEEFVTLIKDRVNFIAPIYVYPGEEEMLALAQGALRVLNGEEKAKEYV